MPREHRRPAGVALALVVVLIAALGVGLVLRKGASKEADQAPPPVQGPGAAGSPLGPAVGFGRGATGGQAGPIYHVTSDADDPARPKAGSLRYGLAHTGPLRIVFDADYVITVHAALPVTPDKTVDGRSRHVTITGPGVPGFALHETHNVILENLTLRNFGDVSKTQANNMPDAISLQAASDVWIDHCTLSMAGDKLVSIIGGSRGVSVSWNHFFDQEQVVQIGTQATSAADTASTVTLYDNFFDGTGYRNPVVSSGKVHAFNNYEKDWKTYGARAERAGQLLLEKNVFEAGDNRRATLTRPGGDGCNDKGTRCDDRPGYLRAVGNLALGHAKVLDSEPDKVFDAAAMYPYTAQPADQALVTLVAGNAGAR